jgi:uncharacterized membrane protein
MESSTNDGAERLANALGWFSIALGAAQVLAPRAVAKMIGTDPTDEKARLMRVMGLREISSGVGILSGRKTDAWMRARVAGDALDLAMLGKTMASSSERGKTLAATVAVLGVTALDILAAERIGTQSGSQKMEDNEEKVEHVRRAITIRKSPEEVAAFWREAGGDEAVQDETVRFVPAPGGRGTEVHLDRAYKKPGRIASVIKTLRHDNPDQQVFDELFALKQILETGEIVVSDAWQADKSTPHPAQPD